MNPFQRGFAALLQLTLLPPLLLKQDGRYSNECKRFLVGLFKHVTIKAYLNDHSFCLSFECILYSIPALQLVDAVLQLTYLGCSFNDAKISLCIRNIT